jgi:hypothetical protein
MTTYEICSTMPCVMAWFHRVVVWLDAHASAASVIVATFALLFTIRQFSVARKHNELSIKPRLFLWQSPPESSQAASSFVVSVKNFGLGPAWLESLQFNVHGRKINLSDPRATESALDDVFPDRMVKCIPLFELHGPYAIPKDGSLDLVRIVFLHGMKGSDLATIRANASVAITYTWAYPGTLVDRWPSASGKTAA